ncbi:MAG: hypothetical protein N2441_04135 [Rhodocyclaceae bacterium]|nr:hypothetical protein [Rhodocyclaceae bacterium]
MSLLIDALKRAEAQQTSHKSEEGDRRPAFPETAKEKVERQSPSPRLPDLPADLSLLDEQFSATKPLDVRSSTPRAASEEGAAPSAEGLIASHEAARLLFTAKERSVARRRLPFWLVLLIATLVATIGLGTYFWWQLQPRSGLGFSPGGLLVERPPAASALPPTTPFLNSDRPRSSAEESRLAASSDVKASSSPAEGRPTSAFEEKKRESEQPSPVRPAETAAQPVRFEGLVRATREHSPRENLLLEAWHAYNQDELELARLLWEKALAIDPHDIQALHGLAAIARRQGRDELAQGYYLRILENDPADGHALAALLALGRIAPPEISVGRLKALVAERPQAAALHFALGNKLAAEERWAEAQQAYFEALRLDPDNPDYAFNLAVSLDRLHQAAAALGYYRVALETARKRPAAFPLEQARLRASMLESLQP